MTKNTLLVFGDSHSLIWEGSDVRRRAERSRFETVKVHYLGASLAFNLWNEGTHSPGKWGEMIFAIVEQELRDKVSIGGIMLCFGEIDVRTQVIKRAISNASSIEQEVAVIAERLLKFARELYRKFRVPVLVWEPVATAGAENNSVQYPAIGTEIERNYATYCFKNYLRAASSTDIANGVGVYSFGTFERMTNFFETRKEFFDDSYHMNLSGLRVALEELDDLCKKHNLNIHEHFAANANLLDMPGLKNIAADVSIGLSSQQYKPSVLTRNADVGFCFHTNAEKNPQLLIDIKYAAIIKHLVLYNRFDGYADRAKHLGVYAGNNVSELGTVHESNAVWGADGTPLIVNFPQVPLRYILLRLNDETCFHLGEVQIMARTFHK